MHGLSTMDSRLLITIVANAMFDSYLFRFVSYRNLSSFSRQHLSWPPTAATAPLVVSIAVEAENCCTGGVSFHNKESEIAIQVGLAVILNPLCY